MRKGTCLVVPGHEGEVVEQLGVVLRPRLLPRVVGGEGDGGPAPLVPAPGHQHQLHLQQGHHVPSSRTGDFPRRACNQEGMFKNTSVLPKYHHLHQDKLWCVCRGIIGRYSRRLLSRSKQKRLHHIIHHTPANQNKTVLLQFSGLKFLCNRKFEFNSRIATVSGSQGWNWGLLVIIPTATEVLSWK